MIYTNKVIIKNSLCAGVKLTDEDRRGKERAAENTIFIAVINEVSYFRKNRKLIHNAMMFNNRWKKVINFSWLI